MRSAKKDAITWAQAVIADPSAVFLDTETGGLGPDADILDIAVVSVDGTILYSSLVHTMHPIPPEATAVHGISNSDLTFQPPWCQVSPTVRAILYNRRVVVYNAKYDFAYVMRDLGEEYVKRLEPTWACAMHAYGAFDGTEAGWRGGYKWWKLKEACEHFGIVPGNHRALEDAEACRQLVIALSQVGG